MVPILIIDNCLELEIIERQHPELKKAPLILLSSNFSQGHLESFLDRGYTCFDETITSVDAKRLNEDIHHLLWNWFLDENGLDLSEIDGCSLGSAFAGSLEHLLNSVVRYQAGLSKLIQRQHVVYHTNYSEDLFLDAIIHLQRKIGFVLHPVETTERQEAVTFGDYGQKFDTTGRKRDLAPLFGHVSLKEKVGTFFLKYFQHFCKNQKRVLLMPAGKHESYFEHVRDQGCPEDFRWILPLSRAMDLMRRGARAPLFYRFSNIGTVCSAETTPVIERLKENLHKRSMAIDPELLIKAMERHTFVYFPGALNYYRSAQRMFNVLKPDLAIFSGDTYENFILAAQAAKQAGIPTATLPHGPLLWGYAEYKSGKFQVFDQFLAVGQADIETYLHAGVLRKKIHITSIPYFERFLPLKETETRTGEYRRALILTPEFYNICPSEKICKEYSFYKSVCRLMDELHIEIIGIKSRHQFIFRNIGLTKDIIEINRKQIPLLAGYTTFPDAVKGADVVIGPASTAIIEAGLMGKDYYVYSHTPFHEFTPSVLPELYDTVNAAFSMEQLRDNILKKQPYQSGCSVYDLVDLEGVQTQKDLFRKFEVAIGSVLESIEEEKAALSGITA